MRSHMIKPSDIAPRIVLASSSPYRKLQLETHLGLHPICIPPNIDETPVEGESIDETAARLSNEKAKAVAAQIDFPALVIAGDQTAAFDNSLIRKPRNYENAVKQLSEFSGKTLIFYSGVCVLHSESKKQITEVVETRVLFRELSIEQIKTYLKLDQPYDCVGAFKNESRGLALFKRVESNDPSALTGLPIIALTIMLNDMGLDVLTL